MGYWQEAQEDAVEFIREYKDHIIETLIDDGEASSDYNNDYPNGDAFFHESYVDRYYNLSEAADLLTELSQFEETDRGLWDGLEPREAIGAQAAYTYGNAVASFINNLIKEINDEADDYLSNLDEDEEEIPEEEKKEELEKIIDEVCKNYA